MRCRGAIRSTTSASKTASPTALPDHDPARSLAGEEGALEVHRDRLVEVLLDDTLRGVLRGRPGVVDKDVQPAEPLHHGIDRATHLSDLTHVALQWQSLATHRLDLCRGTAVTRHVAQSEGDVGACVGERDRDGTTQPARRPGDEGELTGHVEPGQ